MGLTGDPMSAPRRHTRTERARRQRRSAALALFRFSRVCPGNPEIAEQRAPLTPRTEELSGLIDGALPKVDLANQLFLGKAGLVHAVDVPDQSTASNA